MKSNKQTIFISYLLRIWPASGSKSIGWHASLENPLTGERKGFATLALLFVYLEEQIQLEDHCERKSSPQ